jgi:hypothetical protein
LSSNETNEKEINLVPSIDGHVAAIVTAEGTDRLHITKEDFTDKKRQGKAVKVISEAIAREYPQVGELDLTYMFTMQKPDGRVVAVPLYVTKEFRCDRKCGTCARNLALAIVRECSDVLGERKPVTLTAVLKLNGFNDLFEIVPFLTGIRLERSALYKYKDDRYLLMAIGKDDMEARKKLQMLSDHGQYVEREHIAEIEENGELISENISEMA